MKCFPHKYFNLNDGLLGYEAGPGEPRDAHRLATVLCRGLERAVLSEAARTKLDRQAVTRHEVWDDISTTAKVNGGWEMDGGSTAKDRVRLAEALWFCVRIVALGEHGDDAVPVIAALFSACRKNSPLMVAGQFWEVSPLASVSEEESLLSVIEVRTSARNLRCDTPVVDMRLTAG